MSATFKLVECTEDGSLVFWISEIGWEFHLKSFNKGVAVIDAPGLTISAMAELVAECFEKQSGFYGVKRIEFDFGNLQIAVTKENASKEEIVRQYYDKLETSKLADSADH